jgi:hypothetical protein
MSEESVDDTERLTAELVSTKEVTSQEDIREFLNSLEVPVHNRWVDLRSKELGTFDYEPVQLVVSYEFRPVETDTDRDGDGDE